jgi:hypothetical protein
MTEKQAKLKGYIFSGIYCDIDIEEAKRRAKEEREKGLLACVVSKLYKGRVYNTIGYSVYVKDKEKIK